MLAHVSRSVALVLMVAAFAMASCFGNPSGPSASLLSPGGSLAITPTPTEASPTDTPAPSALSYPAATRRPLAGASFERYRWSDASISVGPNALIVAIAETPVGLIAAGVNLEHPDVDATFPPGEDPFSSWSSVVVWTSPDGLTWTKEPDSAQFRGGRPTALVVLDSTVLMFGIGGVCLPDACSGLPPNGGTIVWSSSDGHTWQRLADTGLENGAVTGVAVVDDGLVAVGYVANDGSKPDADPFSDPTDAAVWRSSDGTHWDSVPRVPVADSLASVRSVGSSVIALGSEGYDSLVVWTSDDGGTTWSEGSTISDFWRSIAYGSDGGIVAVSDTNGDRIDGIVYVLSDPIGGVWKRVTPINMRGYRPVQVVPAGDSFVIFGWTAHRDGALAIDDEQQAFSSLDGTDWVPTDVPRGWEGKAPLSVISHGGELVALVGELETLNGPPTDITYTIWVGSSD